MKSHSRTSESDIQTRKWSTPLVQFTLGLLELCQVLVVEPLLELVQVQQRSHIRQWVLPLVWTWVTPPIRLTLCSFGSTSRDVAHCSFEGIREGTCRSGANVWKSVRLDIFQGLYTVKAHSRENLFWLTDIYMLYLGTAEFAPLKVSYQRQCKGLRRSAQTEPCLPVLRWLLSLWLEFGLKADNPELSLVCCCW